MNIRCKVLYNVAKALNIKHFQNPGLKAGAIDNQSIAVFRR